MNTHQTIISQAPNPPQPPAGLTEWGVLGAIVFLVVKEGIAFLKVKDSSESDLTNRLIANIEQTNKELREYLEKESRGSDRTIAAIDRVEQKLSRNATELLIDHRENMARLTAMVAAVHMRLDQAGLPQTHQKDV